LDKNTHFTEGERMNNILRTILIVSAILVLGAGLFLGGMFFNRMLAWNNYGPGWMMSGYTPSDGQWYGTDGMMNRDGRGTGPGGMMGNGYGPGSMMQGYGYDGQINVEPLSMEETEKAVQDYLSYYNDEDLAIKEIMIFDNNSYAIISEKSTGIGAFELLVDPVSKTAYPEYGPNMMWNLKYGMHSGYGMMGGGMMGSYRQPQNVDAKMPVSAEEAVTYAQNYLDRYQPGVTVSDEITPFYGYYTIDLEKEGQIVGMLSVNGYNGQAFPHTWHGTFIEMVHDSDHE
jgi:hypothetical protein